MPWNLAKRRGFFFRLHYIWFACSLWGWASGWYGAGAMVLGMGGALDAGFVFIDCSSYDVYVLYLI